MTTDKYRVLLVDDDRSLLRLLSMRLSAAGYAVTALESAEQALAQIPLVRPHLIITDLQMEGMDGMALFNQVHSRNPSLPVLILTAHGTIPEAVEATSRGVFSYLTKPFDSKVLLQHVERALKITGESSATKPDAKLGEWRKELVTRSPLMENLLTQARLIAGSDASVLIHGQRAINEASARANSPGDSGATSSPVVPSRISSGIAETALATQARPWLCASISTFGRPSRSPLPVTRLASAKRSAARYSASTSSCVSAPRQTMRSPMPSARARLSST